MSRYCKYCGGSIDEKTGICTKCHKPVASNDNNTQKINPASVKQITENLSKKELKKLEKEKKKQDKFIQKYEEKASRPLSKKIGSIILMNVLLFLLLSVLALGVLGTLQYFRVINVKAIGDVMDRFGIVRKTDENNVVEDQISDDTQSVSDAADTIDVESIYNEINEYPDFVSSYEINADNYYSNNSTVIEKIKVSDFENAKSERDMFSFFSERNLYQFPVTYEYSMDGKYHGEIEISNDSDEKHPCYNTFYRLENGDLWKLSYIGDSLIATPMIVDSKPIDFDVFVSESETLMSYDNVTNCYYRTIPNDNVAEVIQVDVIDSNTLNALSYEDLKGSE